LLVYSHHYTGRRAQPRSITAPPPIHAALMQLLFLPLWHNTATGLPPALGCWDSANNLIMQRLRAAMLFPYGGHAPLGWPSPGCHGSPGAALPGQWLLPDTGLQLPRCLEEMDKYKSAGGHVSYLNNLADKTIGCYLASVSIEDTIEILVIGKMKGLHHRAKFTLPEPTKTLAIKDYPLTMFDKVTWPVLGILAIDKGRHAVPWACDTLGVSAKQISSALKGNNIKG
ncbi:hypothetical protein VOLCADRAFT_101263, partial [Volvox carteri f. nagariensis]